MLPNILLKLLFVFVAICWPALQSLHALQVRSAERKVWLFYWVFLLLGWGLFCWFEWILRIPFFVLELVFVEIYGEAQIAAMVYLVSPWSMGIEKLQAKLSTGLSQVILGAMASAAGKLAEAAAGAQTGGARQASAAGAARSEQKRDRPGPYTVIKTAGVMPTMETAKGSVIHQVSIGDEIQVLEVIHNEAERRVRARLEHPPGWISLLNMDNGTRWAVHKDDVQLPQLGLLPQGGEIFANAAAAGCNPTALFQGAQAAAPLGEVSDEVAWEAMAMLESQIARADDFSEDATSRQASGMLKQMLMTLVQTDNPAMLTMAQAMMPDLGKIWANENTRAYLRDLLAAPAPGAASGSATGGGGSSGSGSSPAAAAAAGGSSSGAAAASSSSSTTAAAPTASSSASGSGGGAGGSSSAA